MRKSTIVLVLAVTVTATGCAGDAATSDEYRALEQEVAALEQELSDMATESTDGRASLQGDPGEDGSGMEVPAEVAAMLDEWWAANERSDGSVVELYLSTGYHLTGDEKISLESLAAHLSTPGWTSEWITGPYLIAAEPEGRYVVTRGVRNSSGASSFASALTFEVLTTTGGELKIAQTNWTEVHR